MLSFEKSPPRDSSMYRVSEFQNLDHAKYFRKKNSIDEYMQIEGLLPHKDTLAHGYASGAKYDKLINGAQSHRETASTISPSHERDSIFKHRSRSIALTVS